MNNEDGKIWFGLGLDNEQFKKDSERASKIIDQFYADMERGSKEAESTFKKAMYESSMSVSDVSEKILNQKAIIKNIEADVRKLSSAYQSMGKHDTRKPQALTELNASRQALQEERAALFDLQQQQQRTRLSMKYLRAEYMYHAKDSQKAAQGNEMFSKSLKGLLLKIGGTAALVKFTKDIVSTRDEIQQLEISFTTMLKSKEKADKLMSDLTRFAAETPFGLSSAATGAKQLMAYGSTADTIIDELRMLGDVAAGTGQQLGDLVYLYGTLRTQGRAYMMDIRQFAGRGIPIYEELAKVLNVSTDKVNEFVTAGKVGFKEVEQAFKNMTSESGLYGGLMEEQSKSIGGRIEQLKDNIQSLFNKIGQSSEGVIYSAISGANSLVENYDKIGRILVSLIATYGTYQAAMIVNAALTGGLAASQFKLGVVLAASNKAFKALTATMMANPFVAVATLIAGMVTTMWALRDSTTAAEKSQESYNKRKEEITQKEQEHKSKLEELISVIQDESSANSDRVAALLEIEQAYPDLFKKYIDEKGHIKDLIGLWKEYNEVRAIERVEENKNEYNRAKKEYEDLQAQLKRIDGAPGVSAQYISDLRKEIERARQDMQKFEKDVQSDQINAFISNVDKLTDAQIKAALASREKLSAMLKGDQKGEIQGGVFAGTFTKEQLDQQTNALRAELAKRGETLVNYADIEKKLKKELSDEESKLNKLKLDGEKKYSEDKLKLLVKEQQEVVNAKKKELNEFTNTSGTTKVVKDNRISIEERVNSELLKLRQQNIQDSINLEKTGLEKELALIEHNANVKLEKIKEQERAWKEAQGGELTKEQTIEINTAYKNVGEEAFNAVNKANKDFIDAEKKKNDDILKEFQSYQDKYLAEQEKFAKKRKDLESIRTKDNSPQVDRSLEELKFQEEESLNAINEEFAQREEAYQAWLNQITNLSLEQLISLLEEAKSKLSEIESSGSEQDVATTRAQITQLENSISKVQNGVTPGKRTIKEWGDLHRVLTTVKRSFDEIGDSIGGVAGDAIKTAGEVTASTIMMIDGITTLANNSSTAMAGTAQAAATAIQAVEKASVILAIISAALQITMKIFDLLGGDNTTEKYEKAKEAYESYISILDKVIQKQLELAESLTGENARAAYQQAIDLIKEQSEAARVLGKQYLNSGASWKSRSKGYTEVKDMSAEGWADAAKALGMSINEFKNLMGGRMDGLFDLTDSQLKELAENAHIFWSQLDDDTAKFANQIVDGIKEAAEVIEQKIFDTTLLDKDTMRNDFADMLSDMSLDAKDFAEQFEKYLQNAIINSMMKKEFSDRLSDWRKKMSTFFANDGRLSDEEYRALKEDAEKIAGDMKDQQKILADMFGWADDNDPSKENSLRGAYGRASNESIELLAGQTNAYRVELKNIGVDVASMLDILRSQSPENLNVLSSSIKSSMDSIGMIMQNGFNEFRIMREVTQELRQLKIESNRMAERIEQYNERIADNTKSIADSSNRSAKILDSGTIRVNPTGGGMR